MHSARTLVMVLGEEHSHALAASGQASGHRRHVGRCVVSKQQLVHKRVEEGLIAPLGREARALRGRRRHASPALIVFSNCEREEGSDVLQQRPSCLQCGLGEPARLARAPNTHSGVDAKPVDVVLRAPPLQHAQQIAGNGRRTKGGPWAPLSHGGGRTTVKVHAIGKPRLVVKELEDRLGIHVVQHHIQHHSDATLMRSVDKSLERS